MSKATAVGVLAVLVAAGCTDPKAREIERQRVELEATKAELARAAPRRTRPGPTWSQAMADAHIARTELAKLRGEPAPAPPRKIDPAAAPLEQRFASLKALYDKNAITVNEWTQMKAKVLDGIPKEVSAADKRTLGQRLIDLRGAYDTSAVNVNEWTTAKARLIAQVPSPRAPAPVLDRELTELKKALRRQRDDGQRVDPGQGRGGQVGEVRAAAARRWPAANSYNHSRNRQTFPREPSWNRKATSPSSAWPSWARTSSST